MIAFARSASNISNSKFACAHACFTHASAVTKLGYVLIGILLIGKFSNARAVCTP
jgi:hypothetical protein